MEFVAIYDRLASLLSYPNEDYRQRLARCAEALLGVEPGASLLVTGFLRQIEAFSTEQLQELYTQTFDLNPVCSPEVGWHLFGEQYERGEFLVKMRQQLRRFALPESAELPDHLSHVLAVLGRMEQREADEFAVACVYPALDKMRAAWSGKNNPYESVLGAIARFVESQHARPAAQELPATPVLRVLNGGGAR
jgi:nitrate reductase delta subunit